MADLPVLSRVSLDNAVTPSFVFRRAPIATVRIGAI